MLTFADRGEARGVENGLKYADVIIVRSLVAKLSSSRLVQLSRTDFSLKSYYFYPHPPGKVVNHLEFDNI